MLAAVAAVAAEAVPSRGCSQQRLLPAEAVVQQRLQCSRGCSGSIDSIGSIGSTGSIGSWQHWQHWQLTYSTSKMGELIVQTL